ncbi:MAG: porin family protein [Halomonadaceae bacterium]|nr:MAG: porin family protein [Halomonadaceae bacterium]
MKKLITTTITACALASPVAAENNNYVRLGIGLLDYEDQSFASSGIGQGGVRNEIRFSGYDPGRTPLIRLEIGRLLAPHWRAGLSVESTMASSESDSVSATSNGEPLGDDIDWRKKMDTDLLMANVYYHLWDSRTEGDFDPYVTAGLGIALHNVSNIAFTENVENVQRGFSDGNTAQLALRIGAGAAYWVTERIQVDASVTYLDAGNVQFGSMLSNDDDDDFQIEALNNSFEADITAYELQIGASYQF